jgi:hypothetical protein
LENYYQEAGRSEETVKKAAVLPTSDIIQVENQFIKVLPDKNS